MNFIREFPYTQFQFGQLENLLSTCLHPSHEDEHQNKADLFQHLLFPPKNKVQITIRLLPTGVTIESMGFDVMSSLLQFFKYE